ncbi:hypothetical protein, partial [Pseudonocardia acaciae]|uniref:hypothetical protein n=1 Tax=Pseudonocardia acaciae TaxID=551276 RepID=UPI00056C5653
GYFWAERGVVVIFGPVLAELRAAGLLARLLHHEDAFHRHHRTLNDLNLPHGEDERQIVDLLDSTATLDAFGSVLGSVVEVTAEDGRGMGVVVDGELVLVDAGLVLAFRDLVDETPRIVTVDGLPVTAMIIRDGLAALVVPGLPVRPDQDSTWPDGLAEFVGYASGLRETLPSLVDWLHTRWGAELPVADIRRLLAERGILVSPADLVSVLASVPGLAESAETARAAAGEYRRAVASAQVYRPRPDRSPAEVLGRPAVARLGTERGMELAGDEVLVDWVLMPLDGRILLAAHPRLDVWVNDPGIPTSGNHLLLAGGRGVLAAGVAALRRTADGRLTGIGLTLDSPVYHPREAPEPAEARALALAGFARYGVTFPARPPAGSRLASMLAEAEAARHTEEMRWMEYLLDNTVPLLPRDGIVGDTVGPVLPTPELRRFTALARWWVDHDGEVTTEFARRWLRTSRELLDEASTAHPAHAIDLLHRATWTLGPLRAFQTPEVWRWLGGQALAPDVEFTGIRFAELIEALAADPEVHDVLATRLIAELTASERTSLGLHALAETTRTPSELLRRVAGAHPRLENIHTTGPEVQLRRAQRLPSSR